MVQRKKTGKVTTGAGKLTRIGLSSETIADIDRSAERNNVTRVEATRRLLKSALVASKRATKLKLIRG